MACGAGVGVYQAAVGAVRTPSETLAIIADALAKLSVACLQLAELVKKEVK